MSAAVRARAPRPSTPVVLPPRLRLVAPPQYSKAGVPFVVICMTILVVALLGMLLLRTATTQAAFEVGDAQRQLSRTEQDISDLQAEVDGASSPERLAERARELGMVPATGTGWVRLEDGTVIAVPEPAQP